MSSTVIASLVMASTLVGLAIGALLRRTMPDHHLRDDSKDVIKTASGLIATLVALILGLLVASSKSTFDATSAGMSMTSAKIIQLNRTLVRYGPEAAPVRELLKHNVAAKIEQIWPSTKSKSTTPTTFEDASALESFQDIVRHLTPVSDDQRHWQSQAVQLANDLEQTRWQIFVQAHGYLPAVFLGILIFWLLVLYASFGLLAPRNLTAYSALLVCALSVSAAVFLISEMNRPLDGAITVSDVPMRKALEIISKP